MDDALRVLVEMHKSEFNYYFQRPPVQLKRANSTHRVLVGYCRRRRLTTRWASAQRIALC